MCEFFTTLLVVFTPNQMAYPPVWAKVQLSKIHASEFRMSIVAWIWIIHDTHPRTTFKTPVSA
jgi:hypothetical protein